MDFLSKAYTQLRDLFGSMTPAARITTGLLLAVVIVSLVYLFNYQVSGGTKYLLGGEPIPASHIPAMEAAFAQAGLSDYQIEGTRIKILGGNSTEYMGALADAGALPPQFGSYFEESLAGDSPFASAKDKQERLKVAKQKELAAIIGKMQGIESAAVLYDIRKGRGSLAAKDIVTASVTVKPIGTDSLDPQRVPMIRNLVVGAIAGLEKDNVTVTDLNGRTYIGSKDGISDALEDPYYKRMVLYEKQIRQKALEALSMIPGVEVQVSAELDPELKHIEQSEVYDPKAVVGESEVTTEVENTKGTSPGGRPGLQSQRAQGPAGGAASIAASTTGRTTTTEKETTREKTRSFVSQERKQIEKKGLTPERVKVTVVVPSNYYREVWQSQQGAEAAQDQPDEAALGQIEIDVKKKIEDLVVPLLPSLKKGEDPFPQVTVTTLPSLPRDPLPTPSLAENALAWLGDSWSTLGLCGLAIFSLLMLRSMIKSVPTAEAPTPDLENPTLSLVRDDDGEGEGEDDEEEETDAAGKKLKRRFKKGPNLKDELADLVREDPDAAATILRNWIANTG